MERAAWLERRYGARIEWRAFELHPEYPPEGISAEQLDARYGGTAWRERQRRMFAEAGLPFAPERTRVPSSRKALQLSELARERGAFEELHPRLFDAYWHRDLDIGDPDVLVEEARVAGLDPDEAADVVAGDRYLDAIERETQRALAVGVTGVPAWLVDDRLLIPGAQPHALFEQVLDRLGHRPAA